MTHDKRLAELFYQNFNEAYRSAKLLISSHNRIADLMPLTGKQLSSLNVDDLEKLDAFRVRYCDLQDSLGNKTFRSLLLLEEELPGSNLDILNKIEKREIIKTFDEWKLLRSIRNLFSHDYPETDAEKAEALSIAYSNTLNLIAVVDNVTQYMQNKLNFDMTNFHRIIKKKASS